MHDTLRFVQPSLKHDVYLQTLLTGLGWPLAEALHPAATPGADSAALGKQMQGFAQDELKVQILSLQVVSNADSQSTQHNGSFHSVGCVMQNCKSQQIQA